jgi:hypothetical protein
MVELDKNQPRDFNTAENAVFFGKNNAKGLFSWIDNRIGRYITASDIFFERVLYDSPELP